MFVFGEGTCKVCGQRVNRVLMDMHIEDHAVLGEFPHDVSAMYPELRSLRPGKSGSD
jgi:hypothetical protein